MTASQIDAIIARIGSLEDRLATSAATVRSDLGKEMAENRKHITDLQASVASILQSIIVIQRNSLRVMGAGMLAGAVAIYVLARIVGLG